LGDVLAVGVNDRALDVFQRISGDDEARHRTRTHIAIVPNVAERRLGEEIVEAVTVDIYKPVPLADVDPLETLGPELPAATGATLKKLQLSRRLLNEEISRPVAVDVEELGSRMLEAAEKGERVGSARGVQNGERGNTAIKNQGGRGGRGGRGR
jgi:hypothetical protein